MNETVVHALGELVFASGDDHIESLATLIGEAKKLGLFADESSKLAQLQQVVDLRRFLAGVPQVKVDAKAEGEAKEAPVVAAIRELTDKLTAAFPEVADQATDSKLMVNYLRLKTKIAKAHDDLLELLAVPGDVSAARRLVIRVKALNSRLELTRLALRANDRTLPDSLAPVAVQVKNDSTVPLVFLTENVVGQLQTYTVPKASEVLILYAKQLTYRKSYTPAEDSVIKLDSAQVLTFKYIYKQQGAVAGWEVATKPSEGPGPLGSNYNLGEGAALAGVGVKTRFFMPVMWNAYLAAGDAGSSKSKIAEFLDAMKRTVVEANETKFQEQKAKVDAVESLPDLAGLVGALYNFVVSQNDVVASLEDNNVKKDVIDKVDGAWDELISLQSACDEVLAKCTTKIAGFARDPETEDDYNKLKKLLDASRDELDDLKGAAANGKRRAGVAQLEILKEARKASTTLPATTAAPEAVKPGVSEVAFKDLNNLTQLLARHFIERDEELDRSRSQRYTAWRRCRGKNEYYYCTYRYTPPGTDNCLCQYCVWFPGDPGYVYYFHQGTCRYWGRYDLYEGFRGEPWQWLSVENRKWSRLGDYPGDAVWDDPIALPGVPGAVEDSTLAMLWPPTVGLPPQAPREPTMLQLAGKIGCLTEFGFRLKADDAEAMEFDYAPAPVPEPAPAASPAVPPAVPPAPPPAS